MTITGSFEAFKDWVSDEPSRQADKVLYAAGAQDKVTKVVYARESIEWSFPANETVTFQMLITAVRRAILVTSWTL